jgi:hypothetical protein
LIVVPFVMLWRTAPPGAVTNDADTLIEPATGVGVGVAEPEFDPSIVLNLAGVAS